MMKHSVCFLVTGLIALAAGCTQSGPTIVPIEGTVTHNGVPVPNLEIWFEPVRGRPSSGLSDKAGHYVLTYDPEHKGAVTGEHTIWVIEDRSLSDPTAMMGKAKPKRSPEMQEVLAKYGKKDESPMKLEIKKANRKLELKLD
jgi:hypothetical protein